MAGFAPFTSGALWWVSLVASAAATVTILSGEPRLSAPADILTFIAVSLCASVAHFFPIRSGLGGASYQLTNVFVVAGGIVLDPSLLTPLAALAIAPERWLRRNRPGALVSSAFNVSQTALAMHAASAIFGVTRQQQLGAAGELLALFLAVLAFVAVQELLVAVVISLQAHAPLSRSDNLTRPAMLSSLLLAVMGAVVATLMSVAPFTLLLVIPLLAILHQMTRNAHLAYLAQVDAKTGLHNFRHFEEMLGQEVARGSRLGRPLAVLFIDLDHFKRVNDRFGHVAGDAVLQEMATLLRSTMRKGDLVARYGGEEFVCLLPGASPREALDLAERVRSEVEEHPFQVGSAQPLRCTVSVGVACCPDDADDAATLLRQADAAMYRAKQTRNAVARIQASETSPAETTRPAGNRGSAPHASPFAAPLLWGIVLVGGLLLVAHGFAITLSGQWAPVLPFLLAAVIAELLYVRVVDAGKERISLSLTICVSMAAVTAMPVGAPLVALVASVVHVLISGQRAISKIAFNLTVPVVTVAGADLAYEHLSPATGDFTFLHLGAAFLAVLVFHVLNVGLLAAVVALHTGRGPLAILRDTTWYAPTKIFLGLTGAFVGGAYASLGPLGLLMFVIPILIMRFTLAYHVSHTQQTIETLRTLNSQLESEVAQRMAFQAALEQQELQDSLTELPNRVLLRRRLQEILRRAQGGRVALLVMDLDRFKEVNDTFGHRFGDRVLAEVGPRLTATVRDSDTIARLGGDEFALLLHGAAAQDGVATARRLLKAFDRPFLVDGFSLQLGLSIGIAFHPDHGDDPDSLLRRAEIAMYTAKGTGTGYAIYDPQVDHYSPERLALVGELREALDRGSLALYYQPKLSCRGRRLDSVEALVRWPRPDGTLMGPDVFVPLAEQTGLIRPLTEWVVDAALGQSRAWLDQGLEISVAVNISMRNLHDPELPETISRLLAKWQVDGRYLQLEITESAIMSDPSRAIEALRRLRGMGLRVAIDDFGTGYSSLGYLKQLAVDELKIDKSFVRTLWADSRDSAIVRSAISLGHALGLSVVAEGVEDSRTFELLETFGCDVIQGYYVSRPLPGEDVAGRIRGQLNGMLDLRGAA